MKLNVNEFITENNEAEFLPDEESLEKEDTNNSDNGSEQTSTKYKTEFLSDEDVDKMTPDEWEQWKVNNRQVNNEFIKGLEELAAQGKVDIIDSEKEDLANVLTEIMEKNIASIKGQQINDEVKKDFIQKKIDEYEGMGLSPQKAYTLANQDYIDEFQGGNENDDSGAYSQPLNLLIYGEPGGGKSSIISQWARQHGLAVCSFVGSELSQRMFQGATARGTARRYNHKSGKVGKKDVAQFLSNTRLDILDAPNLKGEDGKLVFTTKKGKPFKYSILVLDELNRATEDAQSPLLSLLTDRAISEPDPEWAGEDGKRHFNKFLFAIAACNPGRGREQSKLALSLAMKTRFEVYYWNANPQQLARFLTKEYGKRIKNLKYIADGNLGGMTEEARRAVEIDLKRWEGRLYIANTVLNSPSFSFSSAEDAERVSNTVPNAYSNSGFSFAPGQGKQVKKDGWEEAETQITLNARTFQRALELSDGTIGSDDPKTHSGFQHDSFLDHLRSNGGRNSQTDRVEDILMTQKDKDDQRNAITKNLYAVAEKALKRYAKELNVTL